MDLNIKYGYNCFIIKDTKYCLLDDAGDIRFTASDIFPVCQAMIELGWGSIHKCKYNGKSLKILEEV